MVKYFKENNDALICIGFILSLFHWVLAAAFCVLLLLYLQQGIRGGVKALIILAIRTNLSKSIASSFGSGGMVKYAVIFMISFYLIYQSHPLNPERLKRFLGLLALFVISNMLTAFMVSSYPITAFFKLISYSVPFYAVVKAIGDDSEYDYIEYMISWFTIVLLASIVAIPVESLNYINGDFQGILLHPNTFGLFGAVYVGIMAYQLANGRETNSKSFRFICIALALVMLYLSKSRTGMFSALIFVAAAYILSDQIHIAPKVVLGIIVIAIGVLYLRIAPELSDAVNKFISKRGETRFLESRDVMKEAFETSYAANPLFGTGFLVPFKEGVRDFSLSFSLVAEPGNLVYAVVGNSGIIGTILFVLYIGYIAVCAGRQKLLLAIIPLMISMGEVAFFSTNNLAVWYYVMYGVCLAFDGENEAVYTGERDYLQDEYEASLEESHMKRETV